MFKTVSLNVTRGFGLPSDGSKKLASHEIFSNSLTARQAYTCTRTLPSAGSGIHPAATDGNPVHYSKHDPPELIIGERIGQIIAPAYGSTGLVWSLNVSHSRSWTAFNLLGRHVSLLKYSNASYSRSLSSRLYNPYAHFRSRFLRSTFSASSNTRVGGGHVHCHAV